MCDSTVNLQVYKMPVRNRKNAARRIDRSQCYLNFNSDVNANFLDISELGAFLTGYKQHAIAMSNDEINKKVNGTRKREMDSR